tara:strand:- start:25 stop:357 length:333 start_codon:yes stop_codon:yes gene_type:complete
MINSKKVAPITGITGQDGSYLAEFLLSIGYEVHGIERRTSSFNSSRIDQGYFRPTEVDKLLGNSGKAYRKLGWETKTSLDDLISEMITKDEEDALKESILLKKGFKSKNP